MDEAQAWEQVYGETLPDGRVLAHVATNDDNDDGWPDGEIASWDATYKSRESFLQHHSGGSHYGIGGVKVTVYLDGKEVVR